MKMQMLGVQLQRGIAMEGEYLLDSAAAPTGQRFPGLEATFDSATFRYLAAIGAGAGWSRWKIGAGGGR